MRRRACHRTGRRELSAHDPARTSRLPGRYVLHNFCREFHDESYQWKTDRGLEIVKTAILAIEYDEDTKKLMSDVKKADALSGGRGDSFLKQSVARGIEGAGENGGGANMAFMGMGVNAAGGILGAFNNNDNNVDPTAKLAEMKKMLDDGLITQEDYDKIKKNLLGI